MLVPVFVMLGDSVPFDIVVTCKPLFSQILKRLCLNGLLVNHALSGRLQLSSTPKYHCTLTDFQISGKQSCKVRQPQLATEASFDSVYISVSVVMFRLLRSFLCDRCQDKDAPRLTFACRLATLPPTSWYTYVVPISLRTVVEGNGSA